MNLRNAASFKLNYVWILNENMEYLCLPKLNEVEWKQ